MSVDTAARTELARKEEAREKELAAAWARDAKSFRSDVMAAACGGLKDLRVARNRAISRAHEPSSPRISARKRR